jgi:hypothetical protein
MDYLYFRWDGEKGVEIVDWGSQSRYIPRFAAMELRDKFIAAPMPKSKVAYTPELWKRCCEIGAVGDPVSEDTLWYRTQPEPKVYYWQFLERILYGASREEAITNTRVR